MNCVHVQNVETAHCVFPDLDAITGLCEKTSLTDALFSFYLFTGWLVVWFLVNNAILGIKQSYMSDHNAFFATGQNLKSSISIINNYILRVFHKWINTSIQESHTHRATQTTNTPISLAAERWPSIVLCKWGVVAGVRCVCVYVCSLWRMRRRGQRREGKERGKEEKPALPHPDFETQSVTVATSRRGLHGWLGTWWIWKRVLTERVRFSLLNPAGGFLSAVAVNWSFS